MIQIDDLLANGAPPFVAILRGVRPDEAVEIAAALFDAGIRIVEVPFNSPQPTDSIARIQAEFGDRMLVGGGTILSSSDVDGLALTGAGLAVMPNCDARVISRTVELGLQAMPGILSPSEAFAAISAGARHLKLFPAESFGPRHLKALREVLPGNAAIWAVGGVGLEGLDGWFEAGARGLGIGGALYRPGDKAGVVSERAACFVAASQAVR